VDIERESTRSQSVRRLWPWRKTDYRLMNVQIILNCRTACASIRIFTNETMKEEMQNTVVFELH
jgi:hypothetical protein